MRITNNPSLALPLLFILLCFISLYSLSFGAINVSTEEIVNALFLNNGHFQTLLIINEVRLPRLLLGVLVGMSLGMSGAVLQALFRNPLADPALIGISSGAALGAITVIVLGGTFLNEWEAFLGYFALPLSAFIGGVIVTSVIYIVATKSGQTDVGLMLLSGIAINAVVGSAVGLLTYFATDTELRDLTFWTMGSVASASWKDLSIISIPILLTIIILPIFAKSLNAFLMGEDVSRHIGFNVKLLKAMVIALTALAVGTSTSVSGIIGFVGLVAPHLVRFLLGSDNRYVILSSAFVGGILVVMADIFARILLSPAELPIGILMSAIGGPFFLYLLIKRRNRVGF